MLLAKSLWKPWRKFPMYYMSMNKNQPLYAFQRNWLTGTFWTFPENVVEVVPPNLFIISYFNCQSCNTFDH